MGLLQPRHRTRRNFQNLVKPGFPTHMQGVVRLRLYLLLTKSNPAPAGSRKARAPLRLPRGDQPCKCRDHSATWFASNPASGPLSHRQSAQSSVARRHRVVCQLAYTGSRALPSSRWVFGPGAGLRDAQWAWIDPPLPDRSPQRGSRWQDQPRTRGKHAKREKIHFATPIPAWITKAARGPDQQ